MSEEAALRYLRRLRSTVLLPAVIVSLARIRLFEGGGGGGGGLGEGEESVAVGLPAGDAIEEEDGAVGVVGIAGELGDAGGGEAGVAGLDEGEREAGGGLGEPLAELLALRGRERGAEGGGEEDERGRGRRCGAAAEEMAEAVEGGEHGPGGG